MALLTLASITLALLTWKAYSLISADMTGNDKVASLNPTVRTHVTLPDHITQTQLALITRQQQYIELVNKYEIVKMQRQLLEQEATIAETKQRIASLNKKTTPQTATKNTFPTKENDTGSLHHLKAIEKNIMAHPTVMSSKKMAPPSASHSTKVQAYTLDEILLLELPPSNYTLVLQTAHDKHRLEQLAKKYHLGTKAMYYSTRYPGETQCVLLYDHFNNRPDANAVFAQLPAALIHKGAKIESVKRVQETIKGKR